MRVDIVGGGEGRRFSAEELANKVVEKRNFEARFANGGGGDEYERYLDFLRILTAETKTKREASQAGTQLGQVGVEVRDFRQDGSKRAEGRRVLAEISKIRPEDRTGEVWKNLRTEFQNIFGKSLDVDAVANVAHTRAEEEKAQAIERAAVAVKVPATPEPVAVVEKPVWYAGMAKDIEILAKGPRSKKKLTDPVQISSAILHNRRFGEAKQNMESSGISLDKDECEYVVAILTLAGARSEEVGKEELSSAIELLRSRNIDVTALMVELGIDEKKMMDGLNEKGGAKGVDIEARIKSIVESTSDLDNTLNDLARLRNNVAREVASGSASARADLEKIDAKIDEFVYKKAEQMRKSGDSGIDPLTVAINEPILGHLEQFRVNVGGLMSREVRVLNKEDAFDGEEIEELIMVQLEKAMKAFNSTVEEGAKPNLGDCETALSVIKRRKESLELLFAERKTPGSQDKQFLSMEIGEKIGIRTLELSEILKNKGIDLTKIDNGVTYTPEELLAIKSLPEYKALVEMRNIEDWVSAEMSVLGYLNMVRLKGQGDKLESLAALGADGKISIPTDAIIGIWTLDKIGRKRSVEASGTELSAYYERASDIEDAICEISAGGSIPEGSIDVSFSGGDRFKNRLGELVARHLVNVDEVTAGGKPKNDFTFLNRYATSLSGQKLARYEAFVKLLMKDENYSLLTGNIDDVDYKTKIAVLDRQLSADISVAESLAREGKPTIHEGEDRFIAFSYANQVAMAHSLGEADKRGIKRVWKPRKPEDVSSYGRTFFEYNGVGYTGDLVVGDYPSCSAVAPLEHFAEKIAELKRRNKLIIPTTLPDAIQAGWVEASIAKTFSENTSVKIGTELKTLELLRRGGMSYVDIAKLLKTQSQPRAHGAYLKQLSSANRLYQLLTCAKKEDVSAVYEGRHIRDVSDAIEAALGIEYDDPEKKDVVDGVSATIYLGLFGLHTGVLTDLTGETDSDVSDIIRMQNGVINQEEEAISKLRMCLSSLIKASVRNPSVGSNAFIEIPGAPLSVNAWKLMKKIIDAKYMSLSGGYTMTKEDVFRSRLLYNDKILLYQKFWDQL